MQVNYIFIFMIISNDFKNNEWSVAICIILLFIIILNMFS